MNYENEGTLFGLALGTGLLLGIAADRLLWAGPVGPGLVIWLSLLGTAGVLLARRRGGPWRATAAWTAVAVGGAAGTAWLASPVLNLLFLMVAVLAASMVILEVRGRGFGATTLRDHAYGLALVPWQALAGPLILLTRVSLPGTPRRRRAVAVGRGVLLALPPVVVFGALFAAADPAFEQAVNRLIPDLASLPAHAFLVAFFGWVAAGLLGGVFPGTRENPLDALRVPELGREEVATILGLVATVFLAFILIQFSYLFGGTEAVLEAGGLTLAEYARRGFFELVAVTVLVLGLLLAMDAAAPGEARRVFRTLALVLGVLVAGVVISAALRLRLYVTEFGLTDARVFAAAIMAWVTVSLGLFMATVVPGRPRRFASGALTAALATILVLAALNPDALVARTNLSRSSDRPVDAGYLTSLSADAVPVLVAGLDRIGVNGACTVASALLSRWAPEETDPMDWRRWNAARAEARAVVSARLPELRARAGACD